MLLNFYFLFLLFIIFIRCSLILKFSLLHSKFPILDSSAQVIKNVAEEKSAKLQAIERVEEQRVRREQDVLADEAARAADEADGPAAIDSDDDDSEWQTSAPETL